MTIARGDIPTISDEMVVRVRAVNTVGMGEYSSTSAIISLPIDAAGAAEDTSEKKVLQYMKSAGADAAMEGKTEPAEGIDGVPS